MKRKWGLTCGGIVGLQFVVYFGQKKKNINSW